MNFWGGPSIESFGRHRVGSVACLDRIALNHDTHLVLAIWELGGRDEYDAPGVSDAIDRVAHVTRIVDLGSTITIVQDHLALVARRWLVCISEIRPWDAR